MKRLFCFFAVLLLAALKSQAQSDVIARIHFLGGDRISADTNSIAFTNEFCSPEARALENQTLDKLANFLAAQFKSPNGAAQLRPLLDDLLKSEWTFAIRDVNGSPKYSLAIRLADDRARLWKKNLSESVTPFAIGTDTGHWTIINWPEKNIPALLIISDEKTNWLSADLNWPRLAQLFPSLREFDFPKIAFQAVGRAGNFQIDGNLNLSQPLPPLESWHVPTNALHQPFISFTAARGVAPWLAKQSWFQPYLLSPQPDQFFVWALAGIPFQTFAAEPVANSRAALTQLYEDLSANQNWRHSFTTPVSLTLTNYLLSPRAMGITNPVEAMKIPSQTNSEILISGFPFAAPNIRAGHDPNGDFLVGGFFPNTPRSKPLPPELFTQLAAPNLVYYHWEITAERLRALPQLSQLVLMVTGHNQLNGQSTAAKWLNRIGPTLGNCVTMASETSPTEISFSRKSPAGLTAIELDALANWLESPKFPAFDLRAPPRPPMRARPRPQTPLMSAPTPAKK